MTLVKFFEYMNETSFPYVVLRNWQNIPDSVEYGEHSDLDLLVYDFDHFFELFPKAELVYDLPRVRTLMFFDEGIVYLDIRHVGDNYYPINFERDLLNNRVFNEKGFYTPCPLDHLAALAYHAAHHKNVNKYKEYLGDATVDELLDSLKATKIGWVQPKDYTVGNFNPYYKGATAILAKEGDKLIKKQINYLRYPLIENERLILELLDSEHFPEVYSSNEDSITIEDCGAMLKVDNLPKNWEEQLYEILEDLKSSGVIHRDIRLDNLTVKDDVIKLIDFGWAYCEDSDELLKDENVPDILGSNYKPTYGFDDQYSIRKIIRELEYKIDLEVEC